MVLPAVATNNPEHPTELANKKRTSGKQFDSKNNELKAPDKTKQRKEQKKWKQLTLQKIEIDMKHEF